LFERTEDFQCGSALASTYGNWIAFTTPREIAVTEIEHGLWASAVLRIWNADLFLHWEFESVSDFYDLALGESKKLIESAFSEEEKE